MFDPESVQLETARILLALTDPHPRNYKQHTEVQIQRRAESLKQFGQVKPIVVRETPDGRYRVYANHSVRLAAISLGWETIEAKLIPDYWSEEMANGYILADNATDPGEDPDLYVQLLVEQQEAGLSLEAVGSSDEELMARLLELNDVTGSAEDTEPREKMVTNATRKQQVKPVLYVQQLNRFEQALKLTGIANRGDALDAICQSYIERMVGE